MEPRKRAPAPSTTRAAPVTLPAAFPWVRNSYEATRREGETHLHRHDCWEIAWCPNANGSLVVDGEERPLPAACVTVVPPGIAHQYVNAPGRRSRWEIVHCDAPRVLPLPWGARPPDTGVRVIGAADDALAWELGRALIALGDRHGRSGREGWQDEARALLWSLLLRLAKRPGAGLAPAGGFARIAPALRLLQERWRQPLRMPALATACGLSPAQFRRRFRAATGVGPRRYLVQLRIQFAARTLRQPGWNGSITQAALLVGFGSTDAFTRAFGAVMGCTPRQWRAGKE